MKRLLAMALCLGLANVAGAQLAQETFEGGTFPPAGWTVYNNLTAGGETWNAISYWNSAYGETRVNETPGWGEAAMIDSDAAGSGNNQDTELWTPAFTVPAGSSLLFANDWYGLSPEYGDVDISIDGGTTWTNLLQFPGTVDVRGSNEMIDLSAYVGATAIVRFHYYNAQWEWWWQVDNVRTGPTPLTPADCGYGPGAPVLFEDFDGGIWPPAGWTVINNGTVTTATWNTNSFYLEPNDSGGTGTCACIDSDFFGYPGFDVDTELHSVAFTVPTGAPHELVFEMFYDYWSSDYGDVDVSTDGGISWTTLATYNSDTQGPITFDFSAYAGLSVIVRFHYVANYDWEWKVDDFSLRPSGIPVPFASAAWRNDAGGTNPDMLDVSGPPVMGMPWLVEVDLNVSGHGYTQIHGYSGQLSISLGAGKVVLTDLTHPGGEILAAPVAAGPIAYYPYTIPNVCSLVGFPMTIQAAGFNIPNNVPWRLSNAQDVVLGF